MGAEPDIVPSYEMFLQFLGEYARGFMGSRKVDGDTIYDTKESDESTRPGSVSEKNKYDKLARLILRKHMPAHNDVSKYTPYVRAEPISRRDRDDYLNPGAVMHAKWVVQTPDGPIPNIFHEAWLELPLSMHTGPHKKWTKTYMQWMRKTSLAALHKREYGYTHIDWENDGTFVMGPGWTGGPIDFWQPKTEPQTWDELFQLLHFHKKTTFNPTNFIPETAEEFKILWGLYFDDKPLPNSNEAIHQMMVQKIHDKQMEYWKLRQWGTETEERYRKLTTKQREYVWGQTFPVRFKGKKLTPDEKKALKAEHHKEWLENQARVDAFADDRRKLDAFAKKRFSDYRMDSLATGRSQKYKAFLPWRHTPPQTYPEMVLLWGLIYPERPVPPSQEELYQRILDEWKDFSAERIRLHQIYMDGVADQIKRGELPKKGVFGKGELIRGLRAHAKRQKMVLAGHKIAAQTELDRLAAEEAERVRLAAEQAERDRLAAEQAERDRLAAEQAKSRERARIAAMPFVPHTYAGLTPFQLYMKEQHGVDVSTTVTPSDYPNMAFTSSGQSALYGDEELRKKLNLPANIKAVQSQNGVVHQIFDPYVTMPKFIGTHDTSPPQENVFAH